jgi:hypothetical protein
MEVAVVAVMDGLRGVFVAEGSVSPVTSRGEGSEGDPKGREKRKWSGEVSGAESWKVGGGGSPGKELQEERGEEGWAAKMLS